MKNTFQFTIELEEELRCEKCPLANWSHDYCGLNGNEVNAINGRRKDCPLVEVESIGESHG